MEVEIESSWNGMQGGFSQVDKLLASRWKVDLQLLHFQTSHGTNGPKSYRDSLLSIYFLSTSKIRFIIFNFEKYKIF